MTQRVQKQIGILPAIETKLHLRQISGQMFRADFVPAPNYSPLQERERRFDAIGMNVAINVNLVTMANGLVLGAFNASGNHCLWISKHFVCDHHINISTDVFLNVLRQRPGLSRRRERSLPQRRVLCGQRD